MVLVPSAKLETISENVPVHQVYSEEIHTMEGAKQPTVLKMTTVLKISIVIVFLTNAWMYAVLEFVETEQFVP